MIKGNQVLLWSTFNLSLLCVKGQSRSSFISCWSSGTSFVSGHLFLHRVMKHNTHETHSVAYLEGRKNTSCVARKQINVCFIFQNSEAAFSPLFSLCLWCLKVEDQRGAALLSLTSVFSLLPGSLPCIKIVSF